MDHEKYKKWILLDYYNELSEKESTELMSHINNCKSCKKEFELIKKELNVIPKKFSVENKELIFK